MTRRIDPWLVATTLVLIAFGLVMVYSASAVIAMERSGDEAPIARLEDVELQPLLRQDVVELEHANGALRDRFEGQRLIGSSGVLRRCDTADRRGQRRTDRQVRGDAAPARSTCWAARVAAARLTGAAAAERMTARARVGLV